MPTTTQLDASQASKSQSFGSNSSSHPVRVGQHVFGGSNFQVIAGPCSIESKEQLFETATTVKKSGACLLRGGIYKMRTNPESFQGLGPQALEYIQEVKAKTNMPMVSEVTDIRQIEQFHDYVDLFQVGSRNMYNYDLLKELGKIKKPVLLKRGFSALVDEWLLAADYIVSGGNSDVILCERGIRTFEKITRNTLDLSAVAYVKTQSDFPVVVDPSHGTGNPTLIEPMALASAACGADGLIVEVHNHPEKAMSDGFQALTYNQFEQLMKKLAPLLEHLGRPLEDFSSTNTSLEKQ